MGRDEQHRIEVELLDCETISMNSAGREDHADRDPVPCRARTPKDAFNRFGTESAVLNRIRTAIPIGFEREPLTRTGRYGLMCRGTAGRKTGLQPSAGSVRTGKLGVQPRWRTVLSIDLGRFPGR